MENFDALVDAKVNGAVSHTNTKCYKAGCCFNEDCGSEGISESECLTNVNCCYIPSADRKDPWCFKKYSATLREEEWCSAWSDKQYYNVPREECFATKKQIGFLD